MDANNKEREIMFTKLVRIGKDAELRSANGKPVLSLPAVYIGKQKGGCGRPEVWESDSVAESFVNIEADDGGEMIAGFNSSFPIELKNKLSFFMSQ